MTLVPAAGHLVHMPGHIFLQTGDFDLAADTNVKAAAADKAFVERTGATGVYPLMYWTHNLHFIAYARAQQGRYEEAKRAALEMVANTGDADREMQMLEGFRLYPLMVDLRFHRWDTIIAEPAPSEDRGLSNAFWHYSRGMAYAGKGRVQEATAEQRRFEQARDALPEESMYLLNNKSSDLLALAAETLAAQIATARGNRTEGIAAWRRALAAERALQYDEPPPWFYTVRQSLGAALLAVGQTAEAEQVFREALATRPRDGRLLYGLWQTLLAQGRASEAVLVENQFKQAWSGATVQLTLEQL
jgi:tetratricopeptide (TPR) repeat protein